MFFHYLNKKSLVAVKLQGIFLKFIHRSQQTPAVMEVYRLTTEPHVLQQK